MKGSGGAGNFGHIPGGVSGQGIPSRGWTGEAYRSYGQAPAWGEGFEAPPGLAAGRRWAEVFIAVDFQVVVSMEEVASTEGDITKK
jgi:hypothetical protein